MVRRIRRKKDSEIEQLRKEVKELKDVVSELKKLLNDFAEEVGKAEESNSLFYEYLTGETKEDE